LSYRPEERCLARDDRRAGTCDSITTWHVFRSRCSWRSSSRSSSSTDARGLRVGLTTPVEHQPLRLFIPHDQW